MNEGAGAMLHDVSGRGRDIDLTGAGYSGASWTNGRYSITTTTGNYRYAFNGKEKDGDIGEDDYDFGARIYDARLGRFLSVDPWAVRSPHESPYVAMKNSPTIYIDPDGRDGVLTITGNTITVHAKIKIYGSGATQATANQMQADIMGRWGTNNGSGWTYTDKATNKVYQVKFDVSVKLYDGKEKSDPFIIPESWDPDNTENFIEVGATIDDVDRADVTWGDEGSWRGVGRNGLSLAQDDPAPHEFGHLLGLDDRYDDDTGPHKGWETNIMASGQTGSVEQRNIDAVVEDGVNRFNVVQKQIADLNKKGKGKLSNDAMHYQGTGTFKYDIDIAIPDK